MNVRASNGSGVVRRVLEEMERQEVTVVQLAARLRVAGSACGWSQEYLAMRLGELLPGPPFGGRVPLTCTEVMEIAQALGMGVAQLRGENPVLAAAS